MYNVYKILCLHSTLYIIIIVIIIFIISSSSGMMMNYYYSIIRVRCRAIVQSRTKKQILMSSLSSIS